METLRRDHELPEPVPMTQPHWYATIVESGCLLCGAGGRQQRVRMPGEPPKDPADRYVVDEHDWACGSHFC